LFGGVFCFTNYVGLVDVLGSVIRFVFDSVGILVCNSAKLSNSNMNHFGLRALLVFVGVVFEGLGGGLVDLEGCCFEVLGYS